MRERRDRCGFTALDKKGKRDNAKGGSLHDESGKRKRKAACSSRRFEEKEIVVLVKKTDLTFPRDVLEGVTGL